MDLTRLFRPADFPRSRFTGGLEVEIEGVRSGAKAIAAFSFSREEVEDESSASAYQELLRGALDASLMITHQPAEGPAAEICAFICRPEHIWRVNALMAVRHCLHFGNQPWSYGTEYLESYLLGYSPAEIDEWFLRKHDMHAGPGGVSLYFLMSAEQAELLDSLGMRALHPGLLEPPILAIYPSNHLVAVSHEATNLIGARVLARVAIKWDLMAEVFGGALGRSPDEVYTFEIDSPAAVRKLNRAFQSSIQIWRDAQWNAP